MVRRTPLSKLRGSGSFRRTAGQKPPRSISLIVCEGETEQEYFEAARIKYGLTTAEIILADNTIGPAPISVVECAEGKCAERGGYDKVFCVFDRDGHESFERARKKIKTLADRKKKPLAIREAISIPCFEFWVLLHHERTDAPFTKCADVIDRVRNHMPGYEKADAAIAKQLMARVEDALGNADWIEGRAENNGYNPYTSVHHVLRHFAQVSNQKVNA
ncbi:MAG: hypothetical protein HMLKMBBP_03676 [Planctomycetes bacterium]|nr:hypothetical protein [Planctomycetota bacterium]